VWLWRARFCKTRALAAKRVAEGEVRVARAGEMIVVDKPSRNIRPGDVLAVSFSGRNAQLRVEAIGDRRGPAVEARALYTLLPA
jgi:ribosome-associated heat shock protein Hsp15